MADRQITDPLLLELVCQLNSTGKSALELLFFRQVLPKTTGGPRYLDPDRSRVLNADGAYIPISLIELQLGIKNHRPEYYSKSASQSGEGKTPSKPSTTTARRVVRLLLSLGIIRPSSIRLCREVGQIRNRSKGHRKADGTRADETLFVPVYEWNTDRLSTIPEWWTERSGEAGRSESGFKEAARRICALLRDKAAVVRDQLPDVIRELVPVEVFGSSEWREVIIKYVSDPHPPVLPCWDRGAPFTAKGEHQQALRSACDKGGDLSKLDVEVFPVQPPVIGIPGRTVTVNEDEVPQAKEAAMVRLPDDDPWMIAIAEQEAESDAASPAARQRGVSMAERQRRRQASEDAVRLAGQAALDETPKQAARREAAAAERTVRRGAEGERSEAVADMWRELKAWLQEDCPDLQLIDPVTHRPDSRVIAGLKTLLGRLHSGPNAELVAAAAKVGGPVAAIKMTLQAAPRPRTLKLSEAWVATSLSRAARRGSYTEVAERSRLLSEGAAGGKTEAELSAQEDRAIAAGQAARASDLAALLSEIEDESAQSNGLRSTPQ